MDKINIVKSAIVGFVVADALGVPVEFMSRERLQENPVTDMRGHGTYDVPKGTWSDDSSMTLCTLHSIALNKKIDLDDIMSEFVKWMEEGYMTPYGQVFDIGTTCLQAIANHKKNRNVKKCGCNQEYDNGNGSLMRILPISCYNFFNNISVDEGIENVHAVSSLTHAHIRSCMACGIYDFIVRELIANPARSSIKKALKKAEAYYQNNVEMTYYQRIFSDEFEFLDASEIKSSGYVVDTLEAALWCLMTTDTYKDCVLKAVNLGKDTDTVGAIAGGLAGILYGYEKIPAEWIKNIAKKDEIMEMCSQFCE